MKYRHQDWDFVVDVLSVFSTLPGFTYRYETMTHINEL